ncbi:MAG: hypothetical protein JWP29_4327, partial [Rhodoferax sp.]|nr:hypothetical protein [Rhodoferax sp.]
YPQAAMQLSTELLEAVARHVRNFDFDQAARSLRSHPWLQEAGASAEARPLKPS